MGIENVFFVLGVTGNVDLRDPFGRNAVHVRKRVKTVDFARHVILFTRAESRSLRVPRLRSGIPIRHFRNREIRRSCSTFSTAIGTPESRARRESFVPFFFAASKVYGMGSKSCVYLSIDASPAQVIGEPWCLCRFTNSLRRRRCSRSNPVRRTEVHGNTVLNGRDYCSRLIEDAQRTAAVDHEIFRDNLEPVTTGFRVRI